VELVSLEVLLDESLFDPVDVLVPLLLEGLLPWEDELLD